jgi:hypothetical protein
MKPTMVIVMNLSTLTYRRGGKAEKEKAREREHGACDINGDPFIEEVKKMREAREETERHHEKFFEFEKCKLEMEQTKLELERDRQDKEIMQTNQNSTRDFDSSFREYLVRT